jgi:hypothetical protein
MAASVIDSLVVTLGLDSKGFAQGIKGSTEELAGFTRRLAGMFLAVRGLEDVVGYFKDLHAQLAEIGFTSRNLGVAGTEIKKLGEVSELFGGQVQDAADSIQNLQNSVFNLRYKGQLSENLLMLQRFGVAYLTASGHARAFKDVALDAARAIDRQAKAAGMDKGERYQMALSFGFTGGVASAVAQGGKGLEEALGKAQIDQRALSEKTIQGQVKLDQDITRLQEATAAQSSAILAKLTPVAEDVVKGLRHLADEVLPKIVDGINALINFFKNPPAWAAGIIDGIKMLANALGPGGTLIAALGALTLAIGAGGALMGVIGTLVTAIGGLGLVLAGGVGLGAAIAKVPSGGLLDKLNEKFLDWFGPGSTDAEKAAIRGQGPANRTGTIARPPATPGAPRPAAPATSGSSTSTTSNATQIHIDEINVNAPRATDADGIAGGIGNALGRKLLVSNADQGQG